MLVLKAGRAAVEALAFGPDSRSLFAPCGPFVVWDDVNRSEEHRSLASPEPGDWVQGPLRVSDDGRFVACRVSTQRGDELPAVYDLAAGTPTVIARSRPKGIGYQNAATTATLTPDGSAIVVCENVSPINGRGQHLTEVTRRPLADPRREAATWAVTTTNVTHNDPVIVGQEVVTAEQLFNETKKCWEYLLVARESATGREVRTSTAIREATGHPVASADGRLVACPHGKKVAVWAAGVWDQPPTDVVSDNKKHFTGIAFHPSGKYLAVTSNDATVKLFDTTSWEVARTFAWDVGKLRSVAFSPDGSLAAAGSEKGQVVVWDVDV